MLMKFISLTPNVYHVSVLKLHLFAPLFFDNGNAFDSDESVQWIVLTVSNRKCLAESVDSVQGKVLTVSNGKC